MPKPTFSILLDATIRHMLTIKNRGESGEEMFYTHGRQTKDYGTYLTNPIAVAMQIDIDSLCSLIQNELVGLF